MPKETIFPTEPDPAPETEWRTCPQVIWSRDLYVQLGVVHASDPESHDAGLFTGNLSRRQLNKLIAVLKRARDAAHGADE